MNVDSLTTPHLEVTPFRRLLRPLFCLLFAAILTNPAVRAGEMHTGNTYALTFTDVDRHQLSTSDGHVTIITVLTRKDEEKAEQVGERVPHVYMGDPKYRLITLVNFQRSIFPMLQGMINAIIRNRMDAEASDLQKIYTEKHLTRNPRSDIYVVADYDGKAVSQLGMTATSSDFAVFVFDGKGRLVRHWTDVPAAEALSAALSEARP